MAPERGSVLVVPGFGDTEGLRLEVYPGLGSRRHVVV
jgi:hypothetical protein